MQTEKLIKTAPTTCCICGSEKYRAVGNGVDFEYDSCANEFEFVSCASCAHHYLQPLPDKSELSVIYPPNYGNYSNSLKPGLAFQVKGWLEGFSLRAMDKMLNKNGTALDIGCGDGRLLDGIKKYCSNITEHHGLEIYEPAVKIAQQKGYKAWVANIDNDDLEAERYDLISMVQVIEHVFNPVQSVEKIYSALKPGGVAWFETPSVECLDFKLFKKRYWGGYHLPRHINLFTPESFKKLLLDKGFKKVEITHKLQPVHWVWSVHHILKEKGAPKWLYGPFNIRNPFWLGVFTVVDALQLVITRRTSNMQIIAVK